MAGPLLEFLDGCDLCGFNLRKYDIRVLSAELRRVGRSLPIAGRHVVDPLTTFHAREKRDLTAALRFYCGKDHEGAHGAEADVLATVAILDAQVAHYEDMPRTIAELHALQCDPDALDFEGNFLRGANGRVVFGFGKYKGQFLEDIASDPVRADYLNWLLRQEFLDDVKAIVLEVQGRMR
jgi:DNA polymerase III subunit epsilon